MQTVMEQASLQSTGLMEQRERIKSTLIKERSFPMGWRLDSTKYSWISFKGYEQAFKPSDATGLQRMYYDRNKPFTQQVKFFNVFTPQSFITKPAAYIIPKGWQAVVDLLKLNNVIVNELKSDSIIEVEAYHIDEYKSLPRPYEKHHKNSSMKVSSTMQKIRFLKGDYIIPMSQVSNRYIMEMLEPIGDDSFFSWNFFDAILQQKEGYSDYRWDDLAAQVLRNDAALKVKLEEKKKSDTKFAADPSAQLDFIYKNSPYYEPGHNRYPVYRLTNL